MTSESISSDQGEVQSAGKETGAEEVLEMLPPIPENWLRLTHFTNEQSAKVILNNDFDYDPGFLSSKTDPFSSLEQMREVLETGNVGPFNRSSFGDCVVLVDLGAKEHKQRLRAGSTNSAILNANIVGYIKIDDQAAGRPYTFVANDKYKPISSEIMFAQTFGVLTKKKDNSVKDVPPQQEIGAEDTSDDVW